jgi:hypothetical protein
MSNRLPGDGLYRFLARVVPEEILRDIVVPTIADLQHEATAESRPRYWKACIQGYVALARVAPRLWWLVVKRCLAVNSHHSGVEVMKLALVVLAVLSLGLVAIVGAPLVGARDMDIGPLPSIHKPNHVVFDRAAETREAMIALEQAIGSAGERAAQDRFRELAYPGMTHAELLSRSQAHTEEFRATVMRREECRAMALAKR